MFFCILMHFFNICLWNSSMLSFVAVKHFYCCMESLCMTIPQSIYPFYNWWSFELFSDIGHDCSWACILVHLCKTFGRYMSDMEFLNHWVCVSSIVISKAKPFPPICTCISSTLEFLRLSIHCNTWHCQTLKFLSACWYLLTVLIYMSLMKLSKFALFPGRFDFFF